MDRCALGVSVALACALSATTAWAQSTTSPHPADPTESELAGRVDALIDTLVEGPMAERERAAADLADLGPAAIPALEDALGRDRGASDQQRRAVLRRINAAVPDEDGRFRSPGRESLEDIRDDDAYDWLAHLVELPEMPGVGSVIADVAAVRALAASEHPEAAKVILDFAFTEDGLVIRDECGRYLRKMAPHSIPALIRGAGTRGEPIAKRRYARYQLGRLDREDPPKALAATAGEDLVVEILRAYGDTLWREAVFAVLDLVDDESPAVRATARETWLAYVTGPPPPEAPKRRLKLPGGKLSDEEEPLYKNARELADHALRRRYAEVLGERPPRNASLGELSETLFEHYDEERQRELTASFEEAIEWAESGEIERAIAEFDRILVQDPDFARRAEMVDAYMARGDEHREAGSARKAAAAYAKAHMLDPAGARAEEARAAQREARAEALASGDEDVEAPVAPAPPPEPAGDGDRQWLLVSGIGVGLVAVVLGVIGFAARRRQMLKP